MEQFKVVDMSTKKRSGKRPPGHGSRLGELKKRIRNLPPSLRVIDREYSSPSGFISHRLYHDIRCVAAVESISRQESNQCTIEHYSWLNICRASILARSYPYFLSKDLLLDLRDTDPPSLLYPLQEVLPILEVIIPSDLIVDEDGAGICCFNIIDLSVTYKMFPGEFDFPRYDQGLLYYVCAFNVYGEMSTVGAYSPHAVPSDLKQQAESPSAYQKGEFLAQQQIRNVALNLLMLYSAYPSCVTTQSTSGSGGIGFATTSAIKGNKLLPSRVISDNFWNTKESDALRQPRSKANRGAKAPHIRRGHWRRVRCGANGRIHEWRWIKPVPINF